jgi:DNA-binding SARP family transcriptional activator
MEVYMQAGQNNAALKQYQSLEQTLRKELNIDPQPKRANSIKESAKEIYTQRLYQNQKRASLPNTINPLRWHL